MAELLELSARELKTSMISILTVLMDKMENMQEQMDNESWVMEIIRKKKKKTKEMLEIKTLAKIKVPLMGFISRLNTTKGRILS